MEYRTLTPEQAERVLAILVAECGVAPLQPGWFSVCKVGFDEYFFQAHHEDADPAGITLTLQAEGLWLFTTAGVPMTSGLQAGHGRARPLLLALGEEFGPCILEQQPVIPGILLRPSALAERLS